MRPLTIALAALALTSPCLAQTTWYVDASAIPPGDGSFVAPYTSLQDAIARRTTLDGDTVSVAPGTYLENLDFLGKAIHVVSERGPQVTVVDAGGVGSAVRFASGESTDSILEGLRLTGGLGQVPAGEPLFWLRGGGVFIDDASPTLRDCVITGNGSQDPVGPGTDSGGGIYVRDGSPWIDGCSITNNTCWQYGGGIDIRGRSFPVIVNTLIASNVVGYGGAVYGGGIHFAGDPLALPMVLGSRIEANSAAYGGGVFGPIELQNSEILDNEAVFGGGAHGAALLSLCTLRGNVAGIDPTHPWKCGEGGGAYESALVDCIVEDNVSCKGGGIARCTADATRFESNVADDLTNGLAVDVSGGAAYQSTLLRCTLVGNSTVESLFPEPTDFEGGALSGCTAERCELRANIADNAGAAVNSTLLHCTVVGNVAREDTGGVVGGSVTNGIVWGNTGGDVGATAVVSYSLVGGGAPGAGNLDLDPKLWNPVAGDLRLTPASPCIDAGDPTSPPDLDDGSPADMGATPFDGSYQGVPRSYCAAKTSSQGCIPAISFTGTPGLSGPDDFHVVATNVRPNNTGIFFWGRAAQSVPFLGGTLCIDGPVQRRAVANSGTPGPCSGAFDRLFSQAYLASHGVSAWDTIYVQCWYRDQLHPDGTGVGLTDALEVTILP